MLYLGYSPTLKLDLISCEKILAICHPPPVSCNQRVSLLPSAVFTWTNLLVVVAELDGAESEVVTFKLLHFRLSLLSR